MSSFVHEARTTEKEDQRRFLQRTRNCHNCLENAVFVFVRSCSWSTDNWKGRPETFPPTNPKQPQVPGKSRKCLRSWMMHGQLKWKTERPPSTNPKMPQIPAKCLKCLRSFMKHEPQKRQTRDVSSNEPETAATAWNVPKVSSFVNDEMEDREASPTSPKMPQIPAKCLKCLRSFMKHEQQKRKTLYVSSNEPETAATAWKVPFLSSFVHETRATEKEDQRRFPQRTRNSCNCLECAESVFVREWCTDNWNGRQRGLPQRTRKCRKSPQSA